MTGRELALRLASALIRRSCRRLPEGMREERLREWTAELPSILDEGAAGRIRRYALAVWFAVGTRRAVRRMTRPAWPSRLRTRTVRAAAWAGAGAAVLLPASLILDLTLGASASPDSLTAAAILWLALLGVAAGAVCAVLLAGLGLAGAATRLRPRAHRPPATPARPARIAAAAFFAAIICITTAIVTGTTAQGQFYGNGILARFADVTGITGLACIALAICLALTAVTARLRHRRTKH